MNVRPLYSSAAVPLETTTVSSKRVSGSSGERPHLRKVTDELILSKRARAMLDEMRSSPEIDTSIRTGMELEQLSEQRVHEVVGRVDGGYYQQPHVLRHVASTISGALVYGP